MTNIGAMGMDLRKDGRSQVLIGLNPFGDAYVSMLDREGEVLYRAP